MLKFLARKKHLLEEYIDFMFDEFHHHRGYIPSMRVSPGYCNGDEPEMRPLGVWWVGSEKFFKGNDINHPRGRLLGIMPEQYEDKG